MYVLLNIGALECLRAEANQGNEGETSPQKIQENPNLFSSVPLSQVGLDKLFLFSCPLFFLTILKKFAHYSYALYPLFPHTIPIILMLKSKKDKFSLKKYINTD